MTLAMSGVVVGAALAVAAGRWLQSLLVGVSPTDGGVLAAAAVVVLAMAALGALLPARRATAIDPIVAIRTE
jgi:ABC-type antimicrobial peptide transport system permease subunit